MKLKFLFPLLFFYTIVFCQTYNSNFKITESTYTSFDSQKYSVYLIESEYCVIQIEKKIISSEQLADRSTIEKILNRIDNLYLFYKNNLLKEPEGGNPDYSFKTNVFFGPPSCGSGCGLLGYKGIEVSGFENIFYNLKHNLCKSSAKSVLI